MEKANSLADVARARNLAPPKTLSLRQFAYRKQAPLGAIACTVINLVIVLVNLRRLDAVYVMPPPAGFGPSLFGSLFPMAIMSSMMTTVMGVRVTVAKRVAGEVTPPLAPGVAWLKPALATAVERGFAVFGLISAIGLFIHYTAPQVTISVPAAVAVVVLLAAIVGYVETIAAALKTRAF